ncbi:formate dehydrogenase accessory sulfurtransferase FdhD [Arsenicicoccus piscis]|uniref:Sulfur carrier protein FdhD n=1 Tax=Arsenicicoccus piscis TaxID=673954 RepID=A0ABQ6HQN8_9MICO|nr:formate dehydrogenase accessory sulfurtransferase FdhD [Arsenicicoccus piscis]MCH8628445.1 formate dehydrogenase accessory sulfurtransferase FdhD [Arsenicicoccus piscis]GMA19994.1 sulfurtransferase FdhD [Arsenicicoccus piscis]
MGRVTQRVPSVRLRVGGEVGREGGKAGAGENRGDEQRAVTEVARPDTVAVEEPLQVRVLGQPLTVTMRTPGDDFDLAIGHLLTEGFISAPDEVLGLMHCVDADESGSPTYNVVDVTAREDVAPALTARAYAASQRASSPTSACGLCGSRSIEDVLGRPIPARDTGTVEPVQLDPETLVDLPDRLRAHQSTFDRTGGTHAAGLFTPAGEVLVVREDVGRHNAVDKVIGAAARSGHWPLDDLVLVVSARAGFEIVAKAVAARVPVVVAVSAPTSLAVALAEEAGTTLVAFTRSPRATVYAHPERVRTPTRARPDPARTLL